MQQAKEKEGRAIAPREVVNLVAKKKPERFLFLCVYERSRENNVHSKRMDKKEEPKLLDESLISRSLD